MADQSGAFAAAARAREEQLVQRLATSVELDRSFEGILRGAHQYNLQSRARLDALEAEIRQSSASWPGLDTPTGARQFQVYLAGKTREIHKVVADAAADSQQRAAQVQALAGQYRAGGAKQQGPDNQSPANETLDDLYQDLAELSVKISSHNASPPNPQNYAAVAEYNAEAQELYDEILVLSAKFLTYGVTMEVPPPPAFTTR
ncbi:DUF4226 domain-containing protein [Mycobacterium sp. SMC-15]|uniref:DUF4226 domain-containing protein n=1 Tax=Mycobacterium sp. SMC-15 TaxID=3381627 RepID=UPI0038775354